MTKTTHIADVVDNDDDHYAALLQILPPKATRRGRRPLRGAWTSPARDQNNVVTLPYLVQARVFSEVPFWNSAEYGIFIQN
jgi:hypothetical protein